MFLMRNVTAKPTNKIVKHKFRSEFLCDAANIFRSTDVALYAHVVDIFARIFVIAQSSVVLRSHFGRAKKNLSFPCSFYFCKANRRATYSSTAPKNQQHRLRRLTVTGHTLVRRADGCQLYSIMRA